MMLQLFSEINRSHPLSLPGVYSSILYVNFQREVQKKSTGCPKKKSTINNNNKNDNDDNDINDYKN